MSEERSGDQSIDSLTAKYERLIKQVRGVQSVRVVLDAAGQVEEIHAVVAPERQPKSIVRDIESILYVRGGTRINHRKVSLVQMSSPTSQGGRSRLQLLGTARVVGEGAGISVTLSAGETQYTGCGVAPAGETQTDETLVGMATVDALRQMVGGRGQFQLEQLRHEPFGTIDVCLAHVSLLTDNGFETLLGVSIVRGDALTSAARAVLDAVNRRLPSLQ